MSLGRGLGALIKSTDHKKDDDTGSNDNKIWQIPLHVITPNSQQPRRHFDPVELQELANSIITHGVLQPIIVTEKSDGGYELIAGERRWRASQIAGLAKIPAIVKGVAEQQKLEIALIENIQRQDLNPLEEAFAYQRLTEEFGLTQQEVADKVGKSRPAVANAIRLLELPNEAQRALTDKKINAGQARALLGIEDDVGRLEMLSSMLGEKITVRELEREVNKKRARVANLKHDPNLQFLEEKLRETLGTKVTITQKGGSGTIVVNYYSKEELAEIVQKITE